MIDSVSIFLTAHQHN